MSLYIIAGCLGGITLLIAGFFIKGNKKAKLAAILSGAVLAAAALAALLFLMLVLLPAM